jgi:hypothetical protein
MGPLSGGAASLGIRTPERGPKVSLWIDSETLAAFLE